MKEIQKSQVIADKKKELYHKSSQYKTAVTSDINRLKFDIEQIGKNFLIIGGSLYLAYKLSKLFGSSSEESKDAGEPQKSHGEHKIVASTREPNQMVLKIKEQITMFLLALAFKKLKEFVKENSEDKDEQENSRDTQ